MLAERLAEIAGTELTDLPVRFAYLFGSRAAGRPRPDSDIDVGVVVEGAFGFDGDLDLVFRIANRFERAGAGGSVAVTILNRAPLRFVGRVLRNRVVIYSRDEPGRVAWESLMGRMADDVEIWAGPLDLELLRATNRGER